MKTDIFTSKQAQRLITYVREQYGEKLEFLWEKFPGNAIWRVSANQKWYGALMRLPRRKITGESDEMVDIIDLRYDREELPDFLRHQEHVYPGWHMNKDNWLTVILDDSLSDEKVINLLDNSREIAARKK